MTFNSNKSSISGHGHNDHNVKLTNIIPSLLLSFKCFCGREIQFCFQTESVSLAANYTHIPGVVVGDPVVVGGPVGYLEVQW